MFQFNTAAHQQLRPLGATKSVQIIGQSELLVNGQNSLQKKELLTVLKVA